MGCVGKIEGWGRYSMGAACYEFGHNLGEEDEVAVSAEEPARTWQLVRTEEAAEQKWIQSLEMTLLRQALRAQRAAWQ